MHAQPPLFHTVANFKFRPSDPFSVDFYKKSSSLPPPLLVGIELNPGPKTSAQLTDKERWWIVFLSQANGKNPTQIAREVGCSRHTVYDVLKKEGKTGDIKDLPRSGRKRKLTASEEKAVVKRTRQVGAVHTAREFSAQNAKSKRDGTLCKTTTQSIKARNRWSLFESSLEMFL